MTVYLDTSTVLRVVLAQADPLAIWGKWDAACASELLGVEARRVLDRLRLDGVLDDEQVGAFHAALAAIERTIDRIRLTRLVLGRAALPMATPVKTLDALHLASALLWRERRAAELSFAPHDRQQARAGRGVLRWPRASRRAGRCGGPSRGRSAPARGRRAGARRSGRPPGRRAGPRATPCSGSRALRRRPSRAAGGAPRPVA